MTREITIEMELKKEVESKGGLCFKLPAGLYSGIPDRLIILPGPDIYFVELKRDEKKKLSPRQEYFRNILFTLRARIIIIKGRSDLEKFLKEYVNA